MFPWLGTWDVTEGVVRRIARLRLESFRGNRKQVLPSPSARLRVRMTNQNGRRREMRLTERALYCRSGEDIILAKWRRLYLAGVGTTSLGGWLVMGAPILDTNFGVWPFTICRMPGRNSWKRFSPASLPIVEPKLLNVSELERAQ